MLRLVALFLNLLTNKNQFQRSLNSKVLPLPPYLFQHYKGKHFPGHSQILGGILTLFSNKISIN